MSRRSSGFTVFLTLCLTVGLFGAAGAAQQKTTQTDGPALATTFRDRVRATEKIKTSKKRAPARPEAAAPADVGERSLQFAARAVRGSEASEAPASVEAGKARVPPFVGRNGTGLGDVDEAEPNDRDNDAQPLDDLPVNVVGYIQDGGDDDYYAITASGGEQIRIEIIADRIFNTRLDSFLSVRDEDDDTLESNNNFFDSSGDSFIQFIPPFAGEHLYYIVVRDADDFGGNNFAYVLNVTVANPPDIGEQEPNDSTSTADLVQIPSVAFGTSDFANDLDVYAFQAGREQTLVVDVDAELYLSLMDPVVELYDNNGNLLFGVDDFDGLDPRFNLVLPYSGLYYIAVSNRDLAGGEGYYYSMNLSLQSAALAPHVENFKLVDGQLRRIFGNRFTRNNLGSHAEINSVLVSSSSVPKKPTTRVKVNPPQTVVAGDVVTVVNPDGRRSNPRFIE